jgi:hypothetical protein
MRSRYLNWCAMIALTLGSMGCCCVRGIPHHGGGCGLGACQGGCGETYVDEWVSHPPRVDACCSGGGGCHHGGCQPVRSIFHLLWGVPYAGGCSSCSGGCDSGCSGQCGYESVDGGCSTCGGSFDAPVSSGGCNCGGGGAQSFEPSLAPEQVSMHRAPSHVAYGSINRNQVTRQASSRSAAAQSTEPRLVPGSVKISPARRVQASVASERVNPARQKMEIRRASYAH